MVARSAANYLRRFRAPGHSSSLLITPKLAGLLSVAAIMRLYYIRQPYVDAFSWRQSSTAMIADNFHRNGWNIFFPEVSWSGPGPSYQGREFQTVSYVAALLYEVVGRHDFVGRAVAVTFGLIGIFALYQLVRRVWDEERAFSSASVLAVMPGAVFIDRSFLPDAAMVALVTLSLWLLVTYLQTDRLSYLLLAGAIGAWGFCTKISGLIVGLPIAYALLAIGSRKHLRDRRRLASIALFGLLTLGPATAYYLWARHLSLSYPPYHFAGAGNWLWDDGLETWWSQGYFIERLTQHLAGWMWTWPVIALVVIGLILRPDKRPDGAPWFFHWWLLGGVILYIAGAKELVNNPWNLHVVNPAAAALAGHAVLWIAASAARATHRFARPVAIILLYSAIVFWGRKGLDFMYFPYAAEGRMMGMGLRELTEPGALVVTIASDPGDPVAIYYSGRRGWVFPPALPGRAWGVLPEEDSESIELFEDLRAGGAGWLGIAGKRRGEVEDRHPRFAEHIRRTCELKRVDPAYVVYRILSPEEVAKINQ